MTTELERLKDWMAEKEHSSASLAKALEYKGNWIERFMSGRHPFGPSLKWRFARIFGQSEFERVFGLNYGRSNADSPDFYAEQVIAQVATVPQPLSATVATIRPFTFTMSPTTQMTACALYHCVENAIVATIQAGNASPLA